jgi:hypothetical protein
MLKEFGPIWTRLALQEGVLAYLCRLTSLTCRLSPMKNHSCWQPGMILPRRDGAGALAAPSSIPKLKCWNWHPPLLMDGGPP